MNATSLKVLDSSMFNSSSKALAQTVLPEPVGALKTNFCRSSCKLSISRIFSLSCLTAFFWYSFNSIMIKPLSESYGGYSSESSAICLISSSVNSVSSILMSVGCGRIYLRELRNAPGIATRFTLSITEMKSSLYG